MSVSSNRRDDAVGKTGSRPGRHLRKAGLVLAVAIAGAAPAAALVQPWEPELGRRSTDGVAENRSPLVEAAKRQLAVARRAQTAEDRQVATPLLRTLGPQTNGVKLDAVRAVNKEWALIPVATVELSPGRTVEDALCVTNGATIACTPAAALHEDGVQTITASEQATTVSGLVPDGVRVVTLREPDGRVTEAEVKSNFFSARVNRSKEPRTIPGPDGETVQAPPMPITATVQWLDADGTVVGPNSKRIG